MRPLNNKSFANNLYSEEYLLILFCFYSIDLNLSRANKLKQTLSKILFERVFDYVVSLVNDISNNSSSLQLKMLDIAGFGNFFAIVVLRDNLDRCICVFFTWKP